MAGIKPFAALHYNREFIADLGQVLAPPYDHINHDNREKLFSINPYNIAHLTPTAAELSGEHAEESVRHAAGLIEQWQQKKVLIRDNSPAMYYYRMTFTDGEDRRIVRRGFFAVLNLEPEHSKVVLPQQSDWMNPRTDRLLLRRAMRTNCSPIFLLFSDPERDVMSLLAGAAEDDPMIDMIDPKGREHTIYRLTDGEAIQRVTQAMAERTVTMADGHHRYRTAQIYAETYPDDLGAQSILACFVPIQDEGLIAAPIHRAVSGLPDLRLDDLLFELSNTFYLRELDPADTPEQAVEQALDEMTEMAQEGEPAFIMGVSGMPGFWLLTVKTDAAKLALPDGLAAPIRDLDVALLQRLILEGTLKLDPNRREQGRLHFFDDPYRLPAYLKSGEAQLAFLCNPIRSNQLEAVAEARLKLPHKVSRFVPEIPAGLVLQSFDEINPHGGD